MNCHADYSVAYYGPYPTGRYEQAICDDEFVKHGGSLQGKQTEGIEENANRALGETGDNRQGSERNPQTPRSSASEPCNPPGQAES